MRVGEAVTIGVVIPSKSNPDGLRRVHYDLATQADCPLEVVTVYNGAGELPRVPAAVIRDETRSIYALWNRGWSYLWELGCSHVVFLNDDVRLNGPKWIKRLTEPLYEDGIVATCPDWTGEQQDRLELVTGTYRHHGMCGYAFAVDVVRALECGALPFDERYHWWYGDDDFTFRVERAGGFIGRVGGLYVAHEESTTINKEDVGNEIASDTALFRGIWGDR